MTRKQYNTMGGPITADTRYNFLVIGKTGNGKSSICNAILGREQFDTGGSIGSTTEASQYAMVTRQGVNIRVVDTPDVVNSHMTEIEMKEEITKWRGLATSKPSLILLAVRCDVRYTAEEYAIYRQILALWGSSLRERLVVVFTFGDRQKRDIREELRTVCPELKSVLKDASDRYIVFNKNDQDSVQGITHELLCLANEIKRQGGSHRAFQFCSKPLVLVLVGLLVAAVVCCIIFAILNITVGAIVTGVIGLLVFFILVAYIYASKGNTILV